jgi:hypothetical protein
MKMDHYLTAYDSETDNFLAFLFSVPSAFMRRVREIAHVAPTDVDAVGSYPLSVDEAHAIAKLLDKQIEIDKKAVFFLEPVSSE